MWWLDPGKEVLNIVSVDITCKLISGLCELQLFNRILAPYVENLDMNQVNYGIGQGLFCKFLCEHHSKLTLHIRSIDST